MIAYRVRKGPACFLDELEGLGLLLHLSKDESLHGGCLGVRRFLLKDLLCLLQCLFILLVVIEALRAIMFSDWVLSTIIWLKSCRSLDFSPSDACILDIRF